MCDALEPNCSTSNKSKKRAKVLFGKKIPVAHQKSSRQTATSSPRKSAAAGAHDKEHDIRTKCAKGSPKFPDHWKSKTEGKKKKKRAKSGFELSTE